ncbi:MAG: Hsp20/alpha crystallin family protein [Candidatus Iainarchaeum archaeon]|uniref:Hsp20/alpha crystallin family protein n=1 Tax=Candidatus Iainarchaeum sp. TaxID=3101447 RepID=A0A7T9DK94_9ARCH|nr:MAG: Hsp20/alpha crystallin family protein [Candidatus Diapherotrites archaeon]
MGKAKSKPKSNKPTRLRDVPAHNEGRLPVMRGGVPSVWDEMHRMQEQMDRMHEAFFGDSFFSRSLMSPFSNYPLSRELFSSRSELYETPTEVKAEIALPGMDKKDIQLHFNENVLEVRAHKNAEQRGNEKDASTFSRSYSSFYRSYSLPHNVDTTKARAKFENGLLRISIPKKTAQKSESQRLEVE